MSQTEKKPRKERMIRLPEDIYQMMKALAEANDRPLAREVRKALLAWIETGTRPSSST